LDAKHRKLDALSKNDATLKACWTAEDGTVCMEDVTVCNVWDHLRMPSENRPKGLRGGTADYDSRNLTLDNVVKDRNQIPITSWRVFLEAALEVAKVARLGRETPIQAFDASLISGESISSLVLEMWMSEIYLQKKRREFRGEVKLGSAKKFADELAAAPRKGQPKLSLSDLLTAHMNELFMVFLLLVEVLDFDRVVEPNDPYSFRIRPSADAAVAARHWYKTAVISEKTQFNDRPSMPARLPGHFSVRGDWYLAVSEGSRSKRLANLGLDFLNSRRANITRLQQGLGLPVRDICPIEAYAALRTALTYFSQHKKDQKDGQRNRRITLPYWDIFAELGACSGWLRGPLGREKDEFNWLWRHRILEYGHQSRIWLSFILSMVRFWQRVRNEGGFWQNGFKLYDQMYVGAGTDNNICVPSKDIKNLYLYSGYRGRVETIIKKLTWNSRIKTI